MNFNDGQDDFSKEIDINTKKYERENNYKEKYNCEYREYYDKYECDYNYSIECYKFYSYFCEKFCEKFCEEFCEKCCNNSEDKPVIKSVIQAMTEGQIITGSNIAFEGNIRKGKNIAIQNETLVLLAKGHIYQVSYNLTSPSNLTIIPQLNGIGQNQYATQNISVDPRQNISVSATFLVDTTAQEQYLDLLFQSSIAITTVVGSAAIIEIE